MYRTIDAAFWTDPKVRKLSANCKLLFLYFITNPHTHVCGLYYVPRVTVQHETGLSNPTLDTLSDTLSKLELCRFDRENDLVWVVKMFRYQGSGEKNLRSAAHHLSEDAHQSRLIVEFLIEYPAVKPLISDRVLHRVSEFGTPDSSLLTPDSRLLITEQKREREQTPPAVPLLVLGEFSRVRLSPDQHAKLLSKLNGNLDDYVTRFDHWVNEAPAAKHNGVRRQDRHAYESISSWFDRDVKDGKVKPPKPSNGKVMPDKPLFVG